MREKGALDRLASLRTFFLTTPNSGCNRGCPPSHSASGPAWAAWNSRQDSPGFLVREGPTPQLRSFVVLLCIALLLTSPSSAAGQADASKSAAKPDHYLVIRTDDAGMSHSVNMALEKLIATGLPISVSVMFPTPWYQETVDILKRHPEVSVGIHLTLNSEWKNYRWGPVLGRTAVPSLVDADGYFFPSASDLFKNNPNLGEVERELRAQVERAVKSGLKIDYLDYHMGTVRQRPEFLAIAEKLAREYGLGMSQYFGETSLDPQYEAAPARAWSPAGKFQA